ncbi:MAG: hypothetical protein LBI63_00250 [Candidatus Ancillula sp.]|jgi:hypothetical protein|nr:hypothetical protein [Candidatus Ancillula sp.]
MEIKKGAVIVIVLALILCIEFYSEKSSLNYYNSQTTNEIENRNTILSQYRNRNSNLQNILSLEQEIGVLVLRINSSYCAHSQYCYGAAQFNSDIAVLKNKFNERDKMHSASYKSVSKMNNIPAKKNLWLLNIFGIHYNDNTYLLNSQQSQINQEIVSINELISKIEVLEKDCNRPPALECGTMTALEKEY